MDLHIFDEPDVTVEDAIEHVTQADKTVADTYTFLF